MQLDLAKLITQRGIPLGLSHLDSFLKSSEYAEAFQTSVVGQLQITTGIFSLFRDFAVLRVFLESYFDFLGKDTHTAAHNREKEILHIQNATRRILPLVVPKRALRSGSATALLTDIVSGAVLQPLMDLLANPDTINLILEVAFDPEPSKTFPPHSGQMTEFLQSFVTSHSSVERPPSVRQV